MLAATITALSSNNVSILYWQLLLHWVFISSSNNISILYWQLLLRHWVLTRPKTCFSCLYQSIVQLLLLLLILILLLWQLLLLLLWLEPTPTLGFLTPLSSRNPLHGQWAVIFIPLPLPKRIILTACCTISLYRVVLPTVLGMGMDVNVTAQAGLSCKMQQLSMLAVVVLAVAVAAAVAAKVTTARSVSIISIFEFSIWESQIRTN